MDHYTKVGKIGNYYGSLTVKTEGDKCYWSIEDWDGSDWEEIPSTLYRALLKFEKARRKGNVVSPIGSAV